MCLTRQQNLCFKLLFWVIGCCESAKELFFGKNSWEEADTLTSSGQRWASPLVIESWGQNYDVIEELRDLRRGKGATWLRRLWLLIVMDSLGCWGRSSICPSAEPIQKTTVNSRSQEWKWWTKRSLKKKCVTRSGNTHKPYLVGLLSFWLVSSFIT